MKAEINQEPMMSDEEMERIIRNAATRRDTPPDSGFGYEAESKPVTYIQPVSYSGDERAVRHVRQHIGEFMLTKPA